MRYEEEYSAQWRDRDGTADLIPARRAYEKGFVTETCDNRVTINRTTEIS